MTRKGLLFAAVLGALAAIGTPPLLAQNPKVIVEKEEPIPIERVPEKAIGVAKGALQADPEKAYLVTLDDGQQVYGLGAPSTGGAETIVLVTPAGEIVETETGELEKE